MRAFNTTDICKLHEYASSVVNELHRPQFRDLSVCIVCGRDAVNLEMGQLVIEGEDGKRKTVTTLTGICDRCEDREDRSAIILAKGEELCNRGLFNVRSIPDPGDITPEMWEAIAFDARQNLHSDPENPFSLCCFCLDAPAVDVGLIEIKNIPDLTEKGLIPPGKTPAIIASACERCKGEMTREKLQDYAAKCIQANGLIWNVYQAKAMLAARAVKDILGM